MYKNQFCKCLRSNSILHRIVASAIVETVTTLHMTCGLSFVLGLVWRERVFYSWYTERRIGD